MNPVAQGVGFVCQNQDAIVWLLGAIGVGNVVAWAKNWLQGSTLGKVILHIANVCGLNWDEVAKALIAALKQPAITPMKGP